MGESQSHQYVTNPEFCGEIICDIAPIICYNRFCSFGEQCVCVLSPLGAAAGATEHHWGTDVLSATHTTRHTHGNTQGISLSSPSARLGTLSLTYLLHYLISPGLHRLMGSIREATHSILISYSLKHQLSCEGVLQLMSDIRQQLSVQLTPSESG